MIRNAYVGMPVRYVSKAIDWQFDSKVTEVAPDGEFVRVDCGGVPLVFACEELESRAEVAE